MSTTKIIVSADHSTHTGAIAGINELWAETSGDPRICIAVLDGPVDRFHPSLAGANLRELNTLVSSTTGEGPAAEHGTHIASVLFGQHDGALLGIAPGCRGLIIPIFRDGPGNSLAPCSQLDLARAVSQAVREGAHIINISGGENSPSGTAHPILADVIQNCVAQGVLVIAAAGNEGCNCLHVPGGLPSVLAVGAMDSLGEPLEFSNWGGSYQVQGILAPGENILGAGPGGKIVAKTGTSYATPVVSGIAALLLSLQLTKGRIPDPRAVRAALVNSATGCDDLPVTDCRRLLAGRLNVRGAMSQIKGRTVMADSTDMPERSRAPAGADGHSEVCVTHPPGAGVQAATSENNGFDASDDPQALPIEGAEADTVRENPSERSPGLRSQAVAPACSCGSDVCSCGGRSSIEFVYALGQLGFDFGTEARRDSIAQHMEGSPGDPSQLLAYLEENPWDGDSIIWTFNFDATAIYAIQPQGAFAREGYERLRRFLKEQLTEGVERVSAAGVIAGKVRLMSGQVVPIVRPDLRCMYSWTTAALVEAVVGKDPAKTAKDEEKRDHTRRRQSVTNFLERVYHELRNLGLTPRERAINWAATNAFNVNRIFEAALKENMELDAIEVERSPVCRPDSDCWDVKLLFFDPENVLRSRKAYRFTVDVSDVCPVTVGGVRSWSVR